MAWRSSDPHFQNRKGDKALPLLVLDICFVRNQSDQDPVTVQVGKLYPTRQAFGCVVDVKGTDEHAICRMTEFIKSAGMHKFVYKCDQESSIKALLDEAVKRSGRAGTHQHGAGLRMCTVLGNSTVGSSASNGRAEKTRKW